jgi:hypothetical protein
VGTRRLCALALPALVSGICLVAPAASANHLEAKYYSIDDFSAACGGADRCWSSMLDDWYQEMDDHGWYHRDGRSIDTFFGTSMTATIFADPDQEAGGRDDESVDEGDAVMIGTHGADSNNRWRGTMRSQGGDENCRLEAPNASDGELFVGDWDLEFLHMSSCNSLDDNQLGNAWRLFQDPADSPGNGNRLHQLDGFHGVMWIYCNWGFRYQDFAEDGFVVSIKDAWLSNMNVLSNPTDPDGDGVNQSYPQCPVAYSVGTSSFDQCVNRLQTERYNAVQGEPGQINYICAYAFEGCTPWGEDAFSF